MFSAIAVSIIAWLLLFHRGAGDAGALASLPAVNATLNATAASLLVVGWIAVRRRNVRLHRAAMIGAFVASAAFLVSYLVYHYGHGDTRYPGHGTIRTAYLLMLASHVLLSIPVVPMALLAFYWAWRKRFDRHRRVTRWLAPIWLYVSVTGVLVFWMLRTA